MIFTLSRRLRRAAAIATLVVAHAAHAQAPSTRISDVLPARAGKPFTTRDIATLIDFDTVSVSPDERSVAVFSWQGSPETNSYRFVWRSLRIDNGAQQGGEIDGGGLLNRPIVEDASWSGAIRSEAAQWSPDSRWFYYRKRNGDDIQVWRSAVDGSVSEQVTHSADPIADLMVDAQGTLLFTTSPAAAGLRARVAKEALQGYHFDRRFILNFSHDPVYAPFADLMAGGAAQPIFAQPPGAAARPASEPERQLFAAHQAAASTPLRTARRGEVEAVTVRLPGNEGPLPLSTIEFRRAGAAPIRCAASTCQGPIDDLGLSADGRQVYFTRREDTNRLARAIYRWDVASGAVMLVHRDASVDIYARCALTQREALCLSEAPDRPRSLARTDFQSGRTVTIFDPNAGLATRRHGPIRRLDIINSWGQPAYAYLTLPPDYHQGQSYPLVVTTYRARGFQRGGIGDEYPIFPFAEQGYAVLAVDRPDEWKAIEQMPDMMKAEAGEMNGMRERRATLETIELGVAELERLGIVDPSRVAITGLSDGAETVNYAITHSKTFKVAIASSGGWEPSMAYLGPDAILSGLGFDTANMGELAYVTDQSVAKRADLVCSAFLVNASQTEYMEFVEAYRQLRERHLPVDLFVYPGDYHIKWQPAHRLAIYDRNIDWLNFWFRGQSPTALVDQGLAPKWQELKAQTPPTCRLP